MSQNDEIDFEGIKARVSVSEVLSRYTHIPSEARFRVACPIHGGDGPNFSVDDRLGLFHCFTCGASGDCITLLATLENITNSEAAKQLAQDYAIEKKPIANFRKIVKQVENYKENRDEMPEVVLPESRQLNGYRRYSQDAIKHFDLRLTDEGVLIPLKDVKGRTVGYVIRQINQEPKYKNSTGLRKADLLYGLFENLEEIKIKKEVILCEGQFDVVRTWDSGYKNVVATMGSSLSPQQARLLMPLANKIVILYDGDEVGRNKAIEVKEKYSSLFKIEIKALPDGTDPDTADLGVVFNE